MGALAKAVVAAVALGLITKLLSSSPLFNAAPHVESHGKSMDDFNHGDFLTRLHAAEVSIDHRNKVRAGQRRDGGGSAEPTGRNPRFPRGGGASPRRAAGGVGEGGGLSRDFPARGGGFGGGHHLHAPHINLGGGGQAAGRATAAGGGGMAGGGAAKPAAVAPPARARAPAPYPPLPPPPPKQKPKGNARPDVLFDIYCPAEEVHGHRGEQCLGTGTDRLTPNPPPPMEAENWELARGSGGPTGCRQAWVTALCDDGFLPAVLVLIHSLRKHATVNRDIVIYTSTSVSQHIVDQVRAEHVRVIAVDPFANNPKAAALVKKNPRYASGYWVVKMFVWRSEEYEKMVFLDGDIYMRANPDPLFCSEVDAVKQPISVTPRSSFDKKAGFNAGMFIFKPCRSVFNAVMTKFESQTEKEMLATSEQDFLNEFFRGRYNIVPIDFIMKHRRMVKEKKMWDENRVRGYHMNGSPKPWQPSWRTGCFYPSPHDKLVEKYEEFFVEWWQYYYEMIGKPMPRAHSSFSLEPGHDPAGKFPKWDPQHIVCPPPKEKS